MCRLYVFMNNSQAVTLDTQLKIMVTQAVFDALHDPDMGLMLRPQVLKRLQEAKVSPHRRTVPFEEMKKKYL